jgi:hypothetical protein
MILTILAIARVPDAGSTVLLLGMAVSGLFAVTRLIKK